MPPISLSDYLTQHLGEGDMNDLIERIASACWSISRLVNESALHQNCGSHDEMSSRNEPHKHLDSLANDVFIQSCSPNSALAALISEEADQVTWLKSAQKDALILSYDPMDGSSNLDVNTSAGSIFAISRLRDNDPANVLPKGRDLLWSGYAIYGPSTMLVLTFGQRVDGFTLDRNADNFVLTHPHLSIPKQTKEFAINAARKRHWDDAINGYVTDCLEGPEGPRAKAFNMRWIASMVADVHRILMRGGVFLYPKDAENAAAGGKLRLIHKAMPMAMIAEAAGGAATNGSLPLLDVSARDPHQRTPVILGAQEEVERIRKAYDQ